MRWRPGHLALLLFQALWLNWIVPGHTRGLIALPTARCQACAGAASGLSGADGRPADSTDPQSPSSHRHAPGPAPRDRAGCALCHFAARLTAPPAVDLLPPEPGFLALAPVPRPRPIEGVALLPTYDGRAPPAAV